MKKNKIIIFIFVVLVIMAILYFVFKKVSNNNQDYSKLYSNLQLIAVKKGDKYGYIDNSGKEVLAFKYVKASPFYGNYALVSKDDSARYQLIDKTGKVLYDADNASGIKYIEDYDMWVINDSLYNNRLQKITKNNLKVRYIKDKYLSYTNTKNKTVGIMNVDNKILYTYKYKGDKKNIVVDIPSNYDYQETYCVVGIDAKYGIVNCDSGKVVYDYQKKYLRAFYNNIFIIEDEVADKDASKENNVNAILVKNDKVDKIDAEKLSETKKDEGVSRFEKEYGYQVKEIDGKKGLYKDDKEILKVEYDNITFLDNKLFSYLKSLGKEYVIGRKDKTNYLINLKDGKTVKEFNSVTVHTSNSSTFVTYIANDRKNIYNLVTGKSVDVVKNSKIKIYNNYATVEGNDINYYNMDLKNIYTTASIKKTKKWK